ncbi:MAG: YciI family protein [Myxococcota bacterium]
METLDQRSPLRAMDRPVPADAPGEGGDMRFVVMAWDGDDPDAKGRRAAVRPIHLENIQPFVDDGHVLVGGAMLDEQGDMIGSTLVVEFDSRADLDAWITADPYVTGGVWDQVEVHPFRPAVGSWLTEP